MSAKLLPQADYVSPKQAARAMGVSESSLKRWCDQGLLKATRTAGGHRKVAIAEVLQFCRTGNHVLDAPEVLGLPAVSRGSESGISNGKPRLVAALLAGDELLARQTVLELYLARHPVSRLCDEVIAAALHEVGELWACNEADIYQERRACEICLRILLELRRLQSKPSQERVALGGTISGDFYTVPTAMVESVLCSAGYRASSLGTSIPLASLVNAVRTTRPALFWLSVSHIQEGLDFITEFAALSAACSEVGTPLVVGGRALSEDLRRKMHYTAYCDNMQHLTDFVAGMQSSARRPRNRTAQVRTSGSNHRGNRRP